MNILFLNEYAYPHNVSGAEYSMQALAEGLRQSGIEVKILSPNLSANPTRSLLVGKFPFPKKIAPGQILSPLWFNNPLFWLYSAYWICRTIKQEKINLIHVHGKYLLPGAVIAGWLARKPVVATVRDFNFLCPLALCFTNQQKKCEFSYYVNKEIPEYQSKYGPAARWKLLLAKLWQYKLKWFLKQADKKIAISPQLAKIYQDAGIKDIISIYNLPPKKPLSSTPKYRLQGKKIIISVGKLSYGKGTDTLLKAMQIIRQKMPNVVLLLAGSKNISLKAKFPVNTRYLGKLSHESIFNLYHSADLFIILSRWPEPLGRATLEALVAGLPIIASNRGGGRNFIKNNGYLVNPDNPQQVAQAISKVLNHPHPALLRRNSFQLLKTRFSRKKIINQHLFLYQKLI